jgi:hypothetical protein
MKSFCEEWYRDRCYAFKNVFAKKIGEKITVFEKNSKFFDENWQKSQKIVIITSTPGPCAEVWSTYRLHIP